VTVLINSGNLAADADVGRAGHKIVTRSLSECLISSTDSETWGARSPLASSTRVFFGIRVITSFVSDCLARSVVMHWAGTVWQRKCCHLER
jgi:hypothetical protein